MTSYPDHENPFRSFWMAGFECTDKLNAFGNRVDFLNLTGHLNLLGEDYRMLEQFNIATVREGIRWSQVEKKPYNYDWSAVEKMIIHAKANNIQLVWDICHFGFPDDLTPLHPMFERRFAALCKAFAVFYRSVDAESVLIVTPINEVSFLSWLGGEVCGTSPYGKGIGWQVKYKLMKAYIEGIEALKEIEPNVRILTTEPLVNIVPPLNASPETAMNAATQHEEQFQVLEMLSGQMCPELRGKPEYLDIIGLNYYFNNQWVHGTNEMLSWTAASTDPRWASLSSLFTQVHARYNRPMLLSETSHPEENRPLWIRNITNECALALQNDIPLWGICLYPVIDRPDWDHTHVWHRSGLWDNPWQGQKHSRILNQPYAEALQKSQEYIREFIAVEPTVTY
ncbi:amine oxidase [Panacibacter sp. DH6]|uniref:Amine oxidase n=1 Tax=Panacibacter microcysteis TaxID=2793269 RepID=A0A931E8P9_9BACT|nr:amine oxidase [Panacibacter microcysteis]MBG9377209.1 amine oxidase [Panacibacter microcysteis]